MRYDYTAVGHVTIDVMADGSRQAGGSAFYSALQAARLGLRALILTSGVEREIEQLLAPHSGEIDLEVLPAAHTTTFETSGFGAAREQRILAWAGPIPETTSVETAILHLAPVARETPGSWEGRAGFVGLTPQGLARVWPGPGGTVSLAAHEEVSPPRRCDAVVISELERASCSRLIEGAREAGATIAVTAGERTTTLLLPGGEEIEVHPPVVAGPHEDLGAGDVFAAALFIALSDGTPPKRAAEFAGAAAALRIAAPGTAGIGGRAAIEARLESDSD